MQMLALAIADPQGRIEVFRDGAWGTVCGHWFWDSNEGADIVCKTLTDANGNHPYAGGTVYTFGDAADSATMPINAGCIVCHNDDSDILTCDTTGAAGNDDGPGWGDGSGECPHDDCRHRHDQGAVCFASTDFVNWGSVAATVQPCSEASLVDDTNMALFFHCVQFASTSCSFDVSSGSGSYRDAMAAFTACEGQTQPAGYCSAAISSAEYLSNQHVCDGGSTTNVSVHAMLLQRLLCGACLTKPAITDWIPHQDPLPVSFRRHVSLQDGKYTSIPAVACDVWTGFDGLLVITACRLRHGLLHRRRWRRTHSGQPVGPRAGQRYQPARRCASGFGLINI